VCWRYEFRDGDWSKIACNPRTGANAKSNDPSTWTSFDDAIRHASRFDGIGFQFGDCGYVGIDLDDCREPTTGALSSFAQQILRRFDSYAEVSPSGAGVKVFLLGNWKDTGKHKRIGKDRIEVYPRLRYFTVTEAKLPEAPDAIKDCQAELDALHT
jgi:putative DNA primase/helicase